MEIKYINEKISVCPQILPEDFAEIKSLGFKSVICNRPDNEGDDQPDFSQIEQECKNNGLQAIFIPVIPGQIKDEDQLKFKQALADLPQPILAYCKTGGRCAMLCSLVGEVTK